MQKNILIKYKNALVLLALIIAIIFFLNIKNKSDDDRIAIPKPTFNNFSEKLGSSVINCQFKVFSDFSFKDDNNGEALVKYGNDSQSEPVNMVFSGLDSENPILKGNNGEDPLLLISNTENEINLASSNSFGDVFFYKIYKNQKVATWYKSYDMFGNPYALLSMGYCY